LRVLYQVVLRLGAERADARAGGGGAEGAARAGGVGGKRPLDPIVSDEFDRKRTRKGPWKRWKIQAKTLALLEAKYQHDRFPSRLARLAIAEDLNVSPRNIQVWFQNQRQRGAGCLEVEPVSLQTDALARGDEFPPLPVVPALTVDHDDEVSPPPAHQFEKRKQPGAGCLEVEPVSLQMDALAGDDEFPPLPVVPALTVDHDDEAPPPPAHQFALPVIHDSLLVGSAPSFMPQSTHYAPAWLQAQWPSAQSRTSYQLDQLAHFSQLLRGFQLVEGLCLALNNGPGALPLPPTLMPLPVAQAAFCGAAAPMAGMAAPMAGTAAPMAGTAALMADIGMSADAVWESADGEGMGLMESLVADAMNDVEGLDQHLESLLQQ